MPETQIIHFDPVKRILDKVKYYLEFKEKFFEEKDKAVAFSLNALKYADNSLKQKMIVFLGSSAGQETAWPLYRMLSDPDEDGEIRYISAIQLRVIFPTLKNAQPLIEQILHDIDSKDPEMRTYAAIAMGWKGNFQAAIPLMALVFDPDIDVMQAAITALSDLGDDRIMPVLLDRLKHGSLEHKRCILFNLWQLSSRQDDVVDVYLEYLEHPNAELRYDALVLLKALTEPEDCLDAYIRCLNDEDSRIRLLALESIGDADKGQVASFKKKIAAMYADPDFEVQEAAKKIMSQL